ncbi:MAG: hypothetical protein U0575_04560 [Phycisphaerales bacterium]
MSTMIQIRHVPDVVHRTLKARAATAGMSLSEFLLREVRKIATSPSPEELRARILALPPVKTRLSAAEMVREERDAR